MKQCAARNSSLHSSREYRERRDRENSDRCLRHGLVLVCGRLYCAQHAYVIRRDHERIKARILAIPARSCR